MGDDRWAGFRRRYVRLGTGELAAAVVFALVAALELSPRLDATATRAFWCALVPLLVLLVQAGAYWLLARRWLGRRAMPVGLANTFRLLGVLDPLLLILSAVGILWWWPTGAVARVLVTVIWTFGLVEYLNYFVVRLAYPPSRWLSEVTRWRTPRLSIDLRRAPHRSTSGRLQP